MNLYRYFLMLIEWVGGFFQESSEQSMTRLISLIVALSGVVYMIKTWDYIGSVAIFTTSGVIKVGGKKIGRQIIKNNGQKTIEKK